MALSELNRSTHKEVSTVARLISLFLYIAGIGFPAHSWFSDVLPFSVKITVTAAGTLAVAFGAFIQWKWSTREE